MYSPKMTALCLLCLCLILQLGCSETHIVPPPKTKATQPLISVVDSAGRQVQLSKSVKRVLSLAPVASEFMAHINAMDLLVGRTDHCNHPHSLSEVQSIGSLFPPNYEKIRATQPDVVLMASGQLDVRNRLERLGIKVFVLQPKALGEIKTMFLTLGALVGRTKIAQRRALSFDERLSTIRAKVSKSRPRVFWEIWPTPLQTVGPLSFMGDLLTQAGGLNIIQNTADPWPKVSNERVVSQNPQLIIASSDQSRVELLKGARPGWGQTEAVQNRHVHTPPDVDIITRPGPRILDGLHWLVTLIASHDNGFQNK